VSELNGYTLSIDHERFHPAATAAYLNNCIDANEFRVFPLVWTRRPAIPFTPFHFGPGFVVKAVAPQRFWLTSFIAANVLIDLEVLYFLRRNETPIHRYLHTYVGGVAMGLLAALGMWLVAVAAIRCLPGNFHGLQQLRSTPGLRLLRESVAAGLLGGVTHILLDSCMHHDMHPYWPFARGNALAGIVGAGTLHIALALAGFFGLILWLLLREPHAASTIGATQQPPEE
jgi:Domain of unknown function (DUF4184)